MKKNFKLFLISISLISVMSCSAKENFDENRICVSEGSYYIYYGKEVIKLDEESYITKDKKLKDYFYNFLGKRVKDKKLLISDLSKHFPTEIKSVVLNGLKPEKIVSMPTIDFEGKEIIDALKLSDLLSTMDDDAIIKSNSVSDIIEIKDSNQIDPEVSLEGKTVAVLNANGIDGFAKKLGESFSKNLKMSFIAENYKEKLDISYVINNKLSEKEFNKFINSIGIKYIKIKKSTDIKPEADVAIITGNDNNVKFDIKIYSTTGVSELKDQIKEYNPKIFQSKKTESIVGVTIKYNEEDKIIAQKLLSYIPSAKLEINNELKNEIEITTNR